MRSYFLLLGIVASTSCCTSKSHWKCSQIDGKLSHYSSSRLSYKEDSAPNTLQMEIIQRKHGCKGYLLLEGRLFVESKEHPKQTLIYIEIDEKAKSYLATRYAGGQKLSLPADALQEIIQALYEEKEVVIQTSGSSTRLDPTGFSTLHQKWKKNSSF